MNILLLINDAFGANGGIAKYNSDLITAMSSSAKVSNVVVITRKQKNTLGGLPLNICYNQRGVSGKLAFLLEVIRTLKEYRRFDLILCGHINLLPIAYLVSKINKIPIWCEIYGIDAWQPHQNRLVNWILQYITGFITISEFTKQRFLGWANIPQDRVVLLPPCYDPADFQPGPKPKYLMERYNLGGKTILLTLGRLDPSERYKGFDKVIEALHELKSIFPNIIYLIAGDGEDKQRLQSKVTSLGLQDQVVFAGFIPENEKQDHYRLADAYVMPGRGEGFGIVYLEAMACGIPVVASKADGSREAVRDGLLGIVVDPDNPDDIKNGILDALEKSCGTPPVGLAYFSFRNFQNRLHHLLDQEFPDAAE